MIDQGRPISGVHWSSNPKRHPKFLVHVPGREIEASFGVMVDALGKGAKFTTRSHIDAIFEINGKLECVVNWISMRDLQMAKNDFQWMVH